MEPNNRPSYQQHLSKRKQTLCHRLCAQIPPPALLAHWTLVMVCKGGLPTRSTRFHVKGADLFLTILLLSVSRREVRSQQTSGTEEDRIPATLFGDHSSQSKAQKSAGKFVLKQWGEEWTRLQRHT